MLTAFLLGLLAVLAVVVVIKIVVLGVKWLSDFIKKKVKDREKHKVAFADTREIVDEYIKDNIDKSDEISMDDLERMCEKTPYVAASIDNETGEITDYEGIKAEETETIIKQKLEKQEGLLIFE